MRIVLKPSARDDLLAIRSWSESRWGDARASACLQNLLQALESLLDSLFLGRPRETLLPGLRSIVSRHYVIFYLADETVISILAVIHEKRNLAALDFADRFEGDDLP